MYLTYAILDKAYFFIILSYWFNMFKRLFRKVSVGSFVTNTLRLVLIIGFIQAFRGSRELVMAFCVFAFFATFLPKILNRFGLKTGSGMQIAIVLIIYGSLFLGEVRGVFSGLWWDILLKAVASVALSFVGLTIILVLEEHEHLDSSPFMTILIAFSLSFSFGAIWEVLEFSLDNILGFGLTNVGTGVVEIDLIIDAFAAFFVSAGGYLYKKKGFGNPISGLVAGAIRRSPKLLKSEKNPEAHIQKIRSIISAGEGPKVEFKSSIRTNLHTNSIDKNIENALLKTIAAYLNTNGGTLIVGVSDNGEILGLERDSFINDDKLKLHLNNLIKDNIGTQLMHLINYDLFELDNKKVLKIECFPSDKRVFVKDNNNEDFYVRNGPSTIKLNGSALVDYVNNRFG